jgi:hypothetical protein
MLLALGIFWFRPDTRYVGFIVPFLSLFDTDNSPPLPSPPTTLLNQRIRSQYIVMGTGRSESKAGGKGRLC